MQCIKHIASILHVARSKHVVGVKHLARIKLVQMFNVQCVSALLTFYTLRVVQKLQRVKSTSTTMEVPLM